MNNKTCSVDALAVFVKKTVILTGERIHTFRGDRGTELTRAELSQYWQEVRNKLELAPPNTPQQIRANERVGRTILNIVRCFLADLILPNFLLGGADDDGRLPEQPDSLRSSAKRDAVHGVSRQGCLSWPSPGDQGPGVRARTDPHQ